MSQAAQEARRSAGGLGVSTSRGTHLDALQALSGVNHLVLGRLAESFPGGRGLATATREQLRALGCSVAQSARVVNAFTLTRSVERPPRSRHTRTPVAARTFILERRPDILDLEVEVFLVIPLNARQRPLDLFQVGQGTLASVDVHPREVFTPLVRMRAHSAIVAHNHPSGDAEPSAADIELTNRLVEAGNLLGIPVLDHLVLARSEFTSQAASGFLRN
jgi:DNA repair protein RadC